MASFDFGAVSAYKFALAGDITANTNTAAIDTQGFEGVAFVTSVGTSNINAEVNPISVTFLEGDDNNISNASALDAKSVVVNPVINASNTAFHASVRPVKRYLFGRYIISAAVTANVHAVGALGFPVNKPTQ